MRRIFEDGQGNKIGELDLPNYGYDARTRVWYRDTMQTDRPFVSSPYASFSIGTPMITLSAPLQGHARGVIATDLKLDKFSDWVYAQRPGEHGTAIIFDSFGALIAHPDFARLVDYANTHPSHPELPEIGEIRSGSVGAVMRRWDGSDHYEGSIRDEKGRDYLFRLQKFSQGDEYSGYSLLLAAEADFAQNVRALQVRGIIIALIAGGAFVPAVWIFGERHVDFVETDNRSSEQDPDVGGAGRGAGHIACCGDTRTRQDNGGGPAQHLVLRALRPRRYRQGYR